MPRKLGRIKIDTGEAAIDREPDPIEVLLPPGAVVFTLMAHRRTPWLYFYYEGPNWRKNPNTLVKHRFLLWFHGEPYSGSLGEHIASVELNATVAHLFRLDSNPDGRLTSKES